MIICPLVIIVTTGTHVHAYIQEKNINTTQLIQTLLAIS